MGDVSTEVVKKIKTRIFMFNKLFRKSRRLWYNAGGKNKRFAFWMTKATHTHSECVIITAFPRQQWYLECASILRLNVHFLCYNLDGACLPRGTDWIFKYDLEPSAFNGSARLCFPLRISTWTCHLQCGSMNCICMDLEYNLISDTKNLFCSLPQCLTGYGPYPAPKPTCAEDKVAGAWSWITLPLAPRLRIVGTIRPLLYQLTCWLSLLSLRTCLWIWCHSAHLTA